MSDGVGEASNNQLLTMGARGPADGGPGEEPERVPPARNELGHVGGVRENSSTAVLGYSIPEGKFEEGDLEGVNGTGRGETLNGTILAALKGKGSGRHTGR